ncbi:hypothetical protein M422DRAFT_43501 [Sphaerobolus stellatus SS14]|nr:hypothetical protein M422DRAFT_43501 [Sphaerobolus stellatus SS14]
MTITLSGFTIHCEPSSKQRRRSMERKSLTPATVDSVLTDYDCLLRNNYTWVDEKAPGGAQALGTPSDVSWFNFEHSWDKLNVDCSMRKNFANFTIKVSRPNKLKKCLLNACYTKCTMAEVVAKIQDMDDVAYLTLKECTMWAEKAFADAKASVGSWDFGTKMYESGLDKDIIPGTAGAWAV